MAMLTIHSLRATMTEVDRLLREYIERFEQGGEADPSDLLERIEGPEWQELVVLIEGYLEHAAPVQKWNADAFEGSLAERAVARVAETWSEASGELPVELVRLRNEHEIKRAELVTELADSLGVPESREKVASYYHRLERGLLPARGVSGKVWDALAKLLGTSAEALRQAGSTGGQASPAAGPAYARMAAPPAQHAESADADEVATPARPDTEEPDEVDRLFTGG
jgi:hypothetical protein